MVADEFTVVWTWRSHMPGNMFIVSKIDPNIGQSFVTCPSPPLDIVP